MPRISKKFAMLLVLAMLVSMFVGMGTVSASTQAYCPSVKTITDDYQGDIGSLFVDVNAGILTDTYEKIQINLPTDVDLENKNGTRFDPSDPLNTWSIGTTKDTSAAVSIVVPSSVDGNDNALYEIINGDTTSSPNVAAAPDQIYLDSGKQTVNKIVLVVKTTDFEEAMARDNAYVRIYFNNINVASGFSGDVTATISSPNDWPTGSVTLATASSGSATVSIDDVDTVTESGDAIEQITIEENAGGALDAEDDVVELALPTGITWGDDVTVEGDWGFDNYGVVAAVPGTYASVGAKIGYTFSENGRTMKIHLNHKSATKGRIIVKGTSGDGGNLPSLDIDESKADTGDVTVDIDGADPDSLVIAKYGDYGATVVAGTANDDMYAGRCDQKIGDFTIVETAPGSLVGGRTITLTLPDYAKWCGKDDGTGDRDDEPDLTKADIDVTDGTDVLSNAKYTLVDDDSHILKIKLAENIDSSDAATIKVKDTSEIMLAPDATGDITVDVGGSAGVTGTVTLGTVKSPVSITADTVKDLNIGSANQEIGDVTITEAAAKALMDDEYVTGSDGKLRLELPAGVTFAVEPTVDATSLDIGTVSRESVGDESNRALVIPINGQSTTAGTIKISGIELTVDRTVPEGAVLLKAKGDAVEVTHYDSADGENDLNNNDDIWTNDEWQDTKTVTSATIANIGTPAPTDQTIGGTFTIGSTSYTTANGTTKTMDVAPYIKDGRTYMPIAYVADALGITSANIVWDPVNQTVTLMKGDKVVQLKIGSTTMLVNGSAITLDAAPEISNGRTCLPIALVAQAFGATAAWDAATQTVTIQ